MTGRRGVITIVLAIGLAGFGIRAATEADAAGPNLLGVTGFESPAVASGSARFNLTHTIGLCKAGTAASVPQIGCWTVAFGNVDLVHASTIAAKGGTQYLDLNGSGIGMVAQSVPVTANTHYELSYWGRAQNTTASAIRPSVYWYNAAGSIISTTPIVPRSVDTTWRQFVVDAPSPAGAVLARVYLRSDTQLVAPFAGTGPLVDQVSFNTV